MQGLGMKPTVRDFPFLRTLGRVLNEALMGFLALAALAVAVLPEVFDIPARVGRLLGGLEWVIVGLFAAEYLVHLVLAPDRGRYVRNGWRLLDLLSIVGPLLSLLPQVSDDLRSAPVLRVLRLLRAVAFGARAGGVIAREERRRVVASRGGPAHAFMRRPGMERQYLAWPEFLSWLRNPDGAWCEVINVSPANLDDLAHATGVSRTLLDSNLFQVSYPHAHQTDRFLLLFLWYPQLRTDNAIERQGILLLAGDRALVSLSPHATVLQELVAAQGVSEPSPTSGLLVEVVRAVLTANELLTGHLERELRVLEEVPVPEGRAQFLQQAFGLKQQLSTMQADLWRIRRLLGSLPSPTTPSTAVTSLQDQAEYLYHTVTNIREGVLSLIELHLNVVSFEMNKVMRVLAIVSALGLVPAVVGGLLGMNLEGNPWSITLPQVTFGVSMGMLLCLYVFYVRGWLR
jgi:Mg2+ and Co2+ transporter CorA